MPLLIFMYASLGLKYHACNLTFFKICVELFIKITRSKLVMGKNVKVLSRNVAFENDGHYSHFYWFPNCSQIHCL